MKILVIGYGNEFREDDRVGHELAPRIAEWLEAGGEDVKLWLGAQLLPELAADMQEVDLTIFVDASETLYPDGFDLQSVAPDPKLEGLNIHSMGPAWLLSLMEELDLRRPETLLITVSGESFNFSDYVTPLCRERIDRTMESFQFWWATRKKSE